MERQSHSKPTGLCLWRFVKGCQKIYSLSWVMIGHLSYSSRLKFGRTPQDWRFPKAEGFLKAEDFLQASRLWVYGVNLPSSPSVWWIFSNLTSNLLPEILTRDEQEDWTMTRLSWGKRELELRTLPRSEYLVPSPNFWGGSLFWVEALVNLMIQDL